LRSARAARLPPLVVVSAEPSLAEALSFDADGLVVVPDDMPDVLFDGNPELVASEVPADPIVDDSLLPLQALAPVLLEA
jgi:hypothetical protein